MGSLILPRGGDVYVDSNAVIYMFEMNPVYSPLLIPLWQARRAGHLRVVTSDLAWMECLVGPLKKSDPAMAAAYDTLFASADLVPHPIERQVLKSAAQLRALHPKLRTPDAIHAATGLLHSVALFITNDTAFRSIPGLPVTVLSDLLP